MRKEVVLGAYNLVKYRDDKRIFDNTSFVLKEKELVGLLGYSGEGKTTLLNILCLCEKIEDGEIIYPGGVSTKGKNKKELLKLRSQHIGYSTQNPSFYDYLSVEDNIEHFGLLFGVNKKDITKRVQELLKLFELQAYSHKKANDLSDGQKKRLDLACALVHKPSILFLDEPTTNLDFRLQEEFLEYTHKINESGVSIIYVSHYIEELEKICSKVYMLKNGYLQETTSKNLKKKYREMKRK